MKKRKPTAGQRMIESARQALAFAKGEENHGCEVHVPDDIDVKAIKAPYGPARAFLTVIAREPDAVRRALLA